MTYEALFRVFEAVLKWYSIIALAIAISTTVSFVIFKVGKWWESIYLGAIIGTFWPAFVIMFVWREIVPKKRASSASPKYGSTMDGGDGHKKYYGSMGDGKISTGSAGQWELGDIIIDEEGKGESKE